MTNLASAADWMIDITALDPQEAVERLIDHALKLSASDLFLFANEDCVAIHVRAMGLMQPISIASADQGKRYLSHIKAMAEMDVSERRRPLDGRWVHEGNDGMVTDLRISTIPTLHGEDAAIRLLVRDRHLFSLDGLGMHSRKQALLSSMLESPSGMILFTGPTGSGKTASLYACLQHLNNGQRKINTIEDPIEFSVDGIRQSQIRPNIGIGFAQLLRSILRQAPDVIMIGEVRDSETAAIAVHAANSGHLVLATMHAPMSAAVVASMHAYGVKPYFLSSALRGVVSQRLVRQLCPDCRQTFDVTSAPQTYDDIRQYLGNGEGDKLYAAAGCEKCHMRGYSGQTAVFEILEINEQQRTMIAEEKSTRDIARQATEQGMMSIRQSALLAVAQGRTSIEEVFRAIPSENLLDQF